MQFQIKPVATLKGKSSKNESISIAGVTTANISPEHAAAMSNIILDIGGKNILANRFMSRVQTEEATE